MNDYVFNNPEKKLYLSLIYSLPIYSISLLIFLINPLPLLSTYPYLSSILSIGISLTSSKLIRNKLFKNISIEDKINNDILEEKNKYNFDNLELDNIIKKEVLIKNFKKIRNKNKKI